MPIQIRPATTEDTDVLWMALSQAASYAEPIDAREADHEIRHYVEGWGQPGDMAVIADDIDTGTAVGAAWIRLLPEDDPGYGFVDAETPELGIGILPAFRGQGIGGRLLDALLPIAAARFRTVSLSTLDTNDVARRLYASRGFETVGHEDGSSTMLRRLDAKDVVRDGYDRISRAYRGDDDDDGQYAGWLTELAALIPAVGKVLDLGCGNGIPVARWLADRGHLVHGVDLSPVMIERARSLVPEATFECADMTSVELPPARWDAVVAFYSLIHVPVDEQPPLLARISSWLRPGGHAMLIVGVRAWTGTEDDWLGATMYWSHTDRETYLAWLAEAGFEVLWDRFIPEGDGGHTLVLARRHPR